MERQIARILWKLLVALATTIKVIIKAAFIGSETQYAKAKEAIDGDSIKINQKGTTKVVRIRGIDAPEYGQKGFKDAKAALNAMTKNQELKLVNPQLDRYGRITAKVEVNGQNVAERLTEKGLVYCSKFHPHKNIKNAQKQAIEKKKGLWKSTPFEKGDSKSTGQKKPWDYRMDKKRNNSQTPNIH